MTSVYAASAVYGRAEYSGRSRPPVPGYLTEPVRAEHLAHTVDPGAFERVTWRTGTCRSSANPNAAMTSRFTTVRVRPANRNTPRLQDGTLPEGWLLIEWPEGSAETTDYWLSTLPSNTPLAELVRLSQDPVADRA